MPARIVLPAPPNPQMRHIRAVAAHPIVVLGLAKAVIAAPRALRLIQVTILTAVLVRRVPMLLQMPYTQATAGQATVALGHVTPIPIV